MKKTITTSAIIGAFTLLALPLKAQFSELIDTPFISGSGFNTGVTTMILQQDGKILVGGTFLSYNGTTGISRMARLNGNGTLDNTFSTDVFAGTAFPEVSAIAVQVDGKIIAGGDFTEYNSASQSGIVRLNSDGSYDPSFSIGSGFDGVVKELLIQNDGRIIVAGNFDNYNDTVAGNIIRLHPNGVIDQSFVTGTGFNSDIDVIALQSDEKLIVGGGFSSYNGTPGLFKLTRLNSDGTLDNTFDVGTGAAGSTRVSTVKILSDGKIAIGGSFLSFNGQGPTRINRLNSDGSLDNTFLSSSGGFENSVWAIEELPNGELLVGGLFQVHNAIPAERLVILNDDGSRNFMFPQEFGMSHAVSSLVLQPDGKALVGGEFTGFMPIATQGVGRIARVIVDEAASVDYLDPAGINFNIYPNPATSEVTLTFTNWNAPSDIPYIIIYDLHGRQVNRLDLKTTSSKLNISSLNKGTYVVQLFNNGIALTERLIVQ